MTVKTLFRGALALVSPIVAATMVHAQNITGPTSSESPYLVGTQPGVITVSLLTVGDAVYYESDGVSPYRMVGIPDGLGAFDNNDGTFTLLMNHELPGNGIVRAHGFRGAFVSRWVVEKGSFRVLHGEDLIKSAWKWDPDTSSYQPETRAYSRFCSADLPSLTSFYNPATGNGFNGRIFMNGEESGTEGRAVAHFLDGNSYELPSLGKLAWENVVAHPNAGDKTVVVGLDDGQGGQVYVYAGQKTTAADPVQAAGLANGLVYGIKVDGVTAEDPATGIPSGTAFTGFNLGNVSGLTGVELDMKSVAGGVTTFQRPEDGCWDPQNLNDFYFVTTASFNGNSRLWRLRFVDPGNPAAGGTITMVLNGTEGIKMMDNITINRNGKLIIQEDVGNNAHLGKVWSYNLATGSLRLVAQHDPGRFLAGAPEFLTQDEESSGVIPMDDILGTGWFLMDVQAHYNRMDTELVEGGQLVAIHLPPDRLR